MIGNYVQIPGGGLDEATADTLYLRLDTANDPVTGVLQLNEELLIGTSNTQITIDGFTFNPYIFIEDDGAATQVPIMARQDDDNLGPLWGTARARGTTASPTVVADTDVLGQYMAAGYDGTDYHTAGGIRVLVDGTPGANDIPASTAIFGRIAGAADVYEAARFGANIILSPNGGDVTIGDGSPGVDYTLTFDGETNDGLITWMEDEDYFQFADKIDATTSGIRVPVSTADTSNPPTDAELDAAFGTPATVGTGFFAILDDAGAGTAVYHVSSDGTNWWYTTATKAL